MKKIVTLRLFVSALVGVALLGAAEAEEKQIHASLLQRTYQRIVIGEPRSHGGLTIFPLSTATPSEPDVLETLDQAISSRKLKVSEWGTGSVPKIRVVNRSNHKVFIMAGEIMTGANQDRMSAHDVILKPSRSPIALPVYCVEQGRWAQNSSSFSGGETAGTKKLRRSAVKKESQGKIWSDVTEKSRQSGVNSSTGTMQAVYRNSRIKNLILQYENSIKDLPLQVQGMIGFVSVINGEINSADLFRDPALFESLWKKLLKACATDAVTHQGTSNRVPTKAEIAQFLSDGMNGQLTRTPNPGLGKEYLVEGNNSVSGSVLFYQSSVVHLALFGPEKNPLKRTLLDVNAPDIQQTHTPARNSQTTGAIQRR